MAPSSETEVTLPEVSDTDCVLVSGRLPNRVCVAVTVASPTPSTIVPDGARIVPDCTMVVASINSIPPADSGTLDAPFDKNVIVVGLGPVASMMNVLPLAG